MKHSLFVLALISLLFFGHNGLGALEIEMTGGFNFLSFQPNRTIAHSSAPNEYKFTPHHFESANFHFKGEIVENVGFNINILRDSILRNSLSTMITAESDYFRMEFGPFVGIQDNSRKPDIGITGSIQAALPGIAFLIINGSASLGTQYDFTGDHNREAVGAKLGFWLPNAIPSVSFNTKSFTKTHDYLTIHDESLRYQVSVEFFSKGSPVIFRLDGGYEEISRSYNREGTEITDQFEFFFAGTEVRWQIGKQLQIIVGFEAPIIFNTVEPMIEPDDRFQLFKFNVGAAIKFR